MLTSYKQLLVWQKSVDYAVEIYRITRNFPKEEQFVLVSQVRRAVISIPSNIAEGYMRGYRREYLQFLKIAFSSGAELETQLTIAEKVSILSLQEFTRLTNELDEIMKMLRVLIQKLSTKP